MADTVETRYYWPDTHTVNGLLAKRLLTSTHTGGSDYARIYELTGTYNYNFDVIVRHSGGSEDVIGSAIAQTSRSATGSGNENATWSCPSTSLVSTDAVKVVGRVSKTSSATIVYITEAVSSWAGAEKDRLVNATWTFYRHTSIGTFDGDVYGQILLSGNPGSGVYYSYITGFTYGLAAGTNVTCTTAPLTLTTFPAAVTLIQNVNTITAPLTLTTFPAAIRLNVNVVTTTALLMLTANTAGVSLGKDVVTTTALLMLTTYQSVVNASTNIQAVSAPLTLTTYPASLVSVINIDATTAALSLTTYNADINLDRNIITATAALILATPAAGVNAETNIPALTAELNLTTYAADVNLNRNISAVTATLTLTAYNAMIESASNQATILSVDGFPQNAPVEYKIHDAILGLIQDWTSVGVYEVQGPTKSAYYITTSVIGIESGTSGIIYWRTSDLEYEASESYDFVNIGLTLARALAGGLALEASVQSRLASASYTAPDNANILAIKGKTDNLPDQPANEVTISAIKLMTELMYKMEKGKLKQVDNIDGTKTYTYYEDDSEAVQIIEFTLDTTGKIRYTGIEG